MRTRHLERFKARSGWIHLLMREISCVVSDLSTKLHTTCHTSFYHYVPKSTLSRKTFIFGGNLHLGCQDKAVYKRYADKTPHCHCVIRLISIHNPHTSHNGGQFLRQGREGVTWIDLAPSFNSIKKKEFAQSFFLDLNLFNSDIILKY